MGKVTVTVKIKNFGEEILVQRGFLEPEQIRQVEKEGVVDTGAAKKRHWNLIQSIQMPL